MNRFVLVVILGLAGGALLASACGPSRPPCSPTTCLGCCDAAGECKSGFDNSGCGTRGNQCTTCGLGQTCVSGACTLPNPGTGGGSGVGGGSSGGTAGGSSGGTSGGTAGGVGGGVTGRCDASNCGGCCDAQGQCSSGRSVASCGSNGASCLSCASTLSCVAFGTGGRCENTPPVGGGSAGGAATGGGTAGGGSSGSCSPQTCPQGCCTATGQCQTVPTTARCGFGGNVCMACPQRQSCVSGTCQPCNGCIDLATGRCESGTQTALCGRTGDFCSDCSVSGTSCVNQACGSSGSCNPSTCTNGCCDQASGVCVPASQQTTQQCGQGSAAALCRSCGLQQQCSASVAGGTCVAAPTDAGFPGLDGGFPFPGLDGGTSFCLFGAQCAVGECCFAVPPLGVCARIGNPNVLGGTTCGRSQQACSSSPCQLGQVCNAVAGVCQ